MFAKAGSNSSSLVCWSDVALDYAIPAPCKNCVNVMQSIKPEVH